VYKYIFSQAVILSNWGNIVKILINCIYRLYKMLYMKLDERKKEFLCKFYHV